MPKRMDEFLQVTTIFAVLMAIIFGAGYMIQTVQAQEGRTQLTNAQQAELNRRTVSVAGIGQVYADPDQGVVRLGVETRSGTASSALEENNVSMQALISALREAGIEDEEIQTQSVNLWPDYGDQPLSQSSNFQPQGFVARNVVEVTVHELANLGTLIDQAIQAGGNSIEDVRFTVSDPTEALTQARQAAMDDAQAKAEQLAALAGAQLGPVIKVESPEQTLSSVSAGLTAREDTASAVPVQPGQQLVQASIMVTWELVGGDELLSNTAGAGSAQVLVSPSKGTAGTNITVKAAGFPGDETVEVGLARIPGEYDILKRETVDEDGRLQTEITIPEEAKAGENWVVVIRSRKDRSLEARSNVFLVDEK